MSIHPDIPEWFPFALNGILLLVAIGGLAWLIVFVIRFHSGTLRRPERPSPSRPVAGIAQAVFGLAALILNLIVLSKGDPAWYTVVGVFISAGVLVTGTLDIRRSLKRRRDA